MYHRKSLGYGRRPAKKNNFFKFFGVWTKKEAEKLDKIIDEEFETIDEEDCNTSFSK